MSTSKPLKQWLEAIERTPGWRWEEEAEAYTVYPHLDRSNPYTLRPITLRKRMTERGHVLDNVRMTLIRAGLKLRDDDDEETDEMKTTTKPELRAVPDPQPVDSEPQDLFAQIVRHATAITEHAAELVGLLDRLKERRVQADLETQEKLAKLDKLQGLMKELMG